MGNTLAPEHITYAIPTAEPPYADASSVFRCAQYSDALVQSMPDRNWNNPFDCLTSIVEQRGDTEMLGSRVWDKEQEASRDDLKAQDAVSWLTCREVRDLALAFAYGLELGGYVSTTEYPDERYEHARKLRMLGIVSKNRPEWFIAEQAAAAANFCLVPLYDSLGTSALLHILKQTEMSVLIASRESFNAFCPAIKTANTENAAVLKHVVFFDKPTQDDLDKARELGVTLVFWKDVVASGRQYLKSVDGETASFTSGDEVFGSPKESSSVEVSHQETSSNEKHHVTLEYQRREHVTTLCYTSGTTGVPKGVLITAGNFISILCGHQRCIMSHPGFRTCNEDIHISYLPLAHVFERMICANCLVLGVRIACYSGDTQKLLDDLRVIRPTVFLSVPRLFMRISDKIQSTLAEKSNVARFIFQKALDAKLKNLREKGIYTHQVWDQLVFRKTKALLGGRIKYMLVGGAPMEPIVQEKISVIFCCPLLHGFGMTEVGPVFICNPGETLAGHIGGVQPCVEFCLRSVPENGYYVGDSGRDDSEENQSRTPSAAVRRGCKGELCVRGPSVTPGYLMAADQTDAVLDTNGWFYTGDIAELLPYAGNAIKIIDRKKNIFKLSQGEYVAPEKLENIYSSASLVGQIFVYGDSTKSQLVALIVPDADESSKWAKTNNIKNPNLKTICECPEFKLAVLKELQNVEQANDVVGFQKVKNIALLSEEFGIDNGLLTPTLKLRRNECKNKYQEIIDELYRELG